MNQQYVEYRDGGYWVAGTRVSLDSLVYRWREGLSLEAIQHCFSSLTLKQVREAISYYLEHRQAIDDYLIQAEIEEEELAQRLREQYPEIHRKLDQLLHTALTHPR